MPGSMSRIGTFMVIDLTHEAGMLPTLNFQRGTFPEGVGRIDQEGLSRIKVSDQACAGCPMPCGNLVELREGPFAGSRLEGPEYETLCLLGSNLGIRDLPLIVKANLRCDQLGLDTMSMGNVIGFAMECFEKGVLTREQTGGLELRFGNGDAVLELIEQTARREGFGEWLALGVREMSRRIGRGSENYAMQVKGLELPGYDPRGAFGAALTFAVNPRGGCHRRAWPPAKEILGGVPPYTVEGKAAMVKGMFDERTILHSLIVCDFHAGLIPLKMDFYSRALSMVTGEEWEIERLYRVAERTETLIRLFNCREGFSRQDDQIPARILEESLPDGPARGQKIGRAGFDRMLDEYYELRGWGPDGCPREETLKQLEVAR